MDGKEEPPNFVTSQSCQHGDEMKPFCLNCGVRESIKSNADLERLYLQLDSELSEIGKKRVTIKADGHCLPKAVFTAMKRKNLIPDIISYKQLFRSAIDSISHQNFLKDWQSDSQEETMKQLKLYLDEKKYNSNIVDTFITALAEVCSVTIICYYLTNSELKTHIFKPSSKKSLTSIDVSFVHGHYDTVVDSLEPFITKLPSKHSSKIIVIDDSSPTAGSCSQDRNHIESYTNDGSIPISDSPFKKIPQERQSLEIDVKPVKFEFKNEPAYNFKYDTSCLNDSDANSVNDDFVTDISDSETTFDDSDMPVRLIGKRRYVQSTVFSDIEPIKVNEVPYDIDGTVVYIVPENNGSLQTCKGGRPWCKAQSSKSKEFKKGPRLLLNCRGSYMCQNKSCKNIGDFGVNRVDFLDKGGQILCTICSFKACFIPCDARLILEKDVEEKLITCKHYGTHTCMAQTKGRPQKTEMQNIFSTYPKLTRESVIRQQIQSTLEETSYREAVEKARTFTDTNFVDNIKKKTSSFKRPEGHSFQAVSLIRDRYLPEDKFLIFDFHDGSGETPPFLVKSSLLKVELMINLDKDGEHRLSREVVFLDVLHSRCKSWKTYTLSYYDDVLRQLIKLVTMEVQKEDGTCCELFFSTINRMCQQYLCDRDNKVDSNYLFNPSVIQCDEHHGNRLGIAAVYGNEFVVKRTLSCEYHFDKSVERHKTFVSKDDRRQYQNLALSLKNAITEQAYLTAKLNLEELIQSQIEGNQKPLRDTLDFWDKIKFRWATAFKSNLHNTPKSSLAEAAQASMKAANEKNISLVDTIFADIADSARLDAKWQNRLSGERCPGQGPSASHLSDRYEQRQIDRVLRFSQEVTAANDINEDNDAEEPPTKVTRIDSSNSNLPKVKKTRLRSLDTKFMKNCISRAHDINDHTKVLNLTKADDFVKCIIESKSSQLHLEFSTEFKCSCSVSQSSQKKTCAHIIWCLTRIFNIQENESLLAQVEVSKEIFCDLLRKLPDVLPDKLLACT